MGFTVIFYPSASLYFDDRFTISCSCSCVFSPLIYFTRLCLSSGHVASGGRSEEPPLGCGPDPGHARFPRPQQTQPQRAAHTETGTITHTHRACLQCSFNHTLIHSSSLSNAPCRSLSSVCWWTWRASSSRWRQCSGVRAPSGYQRRWWPVCRPAVRLRLCSKRPANCSTPPSSSATSCR